MLEINFLEMTTSLKRNDTQSLIQVLPMSMGSSLESPQTLWEGSCGNGLKDTFFFFLNLGDREVAQCPGVLHHFPAYGHRTWTYCHIFEFKSFWGLQHLPWMKFFGCLKCTKCLISVRLNSSMSLVLVCNGPFWLFLTDHQKSQFSVSS